MRVDSGPFGITRFSHAIAWQDEGKFAGVNVGGYDLDLETTD